MDAGQIGELWFLYSVFHKSLEKEASLRLTTELTSRGGHVLAMLCHAKILLLELSDGRRFTVESSANLRSCGSVEQFFMVNDAELYEFHSGWINSLFDKAAHDARTTDHLDPTAVAKWQEIAPTLDITLPGTADALSAYCVSYSRWRAAEVQVAALGLIVKSPAGFPTEIHFSAWSSDAIVSQGACAVALLGQGMEKPGQFLEPSPA